jgi:hypothetical protein
MNSEFDSNIICKYPRISQNDITTTFVYVNSENSIEKVISETHTLVDMTLPYSQILHLIQTKKNTPTAKYKLIDILLYSVDIDHSNIVDYASTPTEDYNSSFFKVMPWYESIIISPSIFAFHRVNSVYFIFKEKNRMPPKSILKSNDSSSIGFKKTKKNDHKNRAHTKRVNFA